MIGRYRLTHPLLAIFAAPDGHEAITIPSETIVDLDGQTFNGHRLMEVLFEGRKVLMFTEDLKGASVPA